MVVPFFYRIILSKILKNEEQTNSSHFVLHSSLHSRLAQQLTHLVGEVSGIIAVHDTIIDDREAKLMPIRRLAIASERDDARQRAGLRLHVAMGITRFHALLQRAIDTSDRQGCFNC